MKWLVTILSAMLLSLQYSLWFSDSSLISSWRMKQAIETQLQQNKTLRERNLALDAEVRDLKTGTAAVEERARSELGLIRSEETFYQVIR
ncbi:MAG: cell division protein FtsB [Gammaproteobacteria bacterium]|nr:cell division protein FtsB [Gammaproteobacteria bacterium]